MTNDECIQRRPSPWGNDAFPPCFRFPSPLFPKIYQTPWKIFPISPFPTKLLRFSSAKISDDFFVVIDWKCWIFTYFRCFSTFPLFREIIISLYLFKFPLWFRKIYVFFTYFMYFLFPPSLTMMHLCITQCTYWTPLNTGPNRGLHFIVSANRWTWYIK